MFEELEPQNILRPVIYSLSLDSQTVSLSLQMMSSPTSLIPPGWPDSLSHSPPITMTTCLSPMGLRPLTVS